MIDPFSEGLHIRGPMKLCKLLEFIRTTLDDLSAAEFNRYVSIKKPTGTIVSGNIEVEKSLYEDTHAFDLQSDV